MPREDIDMERTVWADPTFEAKLEDINFDGRDDLIISLGQDGVTVYEIEETDLCYESVEETFENTGEREEEGDDTNYDICVCYENLIHLNSELTHNEMEIESVTVDEHTDNTLLCVINGKEYSLNIQDYVFVYVPELFVTELADVTGDGKLDLIVNFRIAGNTFSETLSHTHVFTTHRNSFEQILFVDGWGEENGVEKWDEEWTFNEGCTVSEKGEIVFDVTKCIYEDEERICEGGKIILKYSDDNWIIIKN